jgi:hypothetical protein
VRFNNLHVHTAATDVKGIARGIGKALQDHAFASQGESALV